MVEQRTSLWTLLLNLSSKEDLCLIERHFFFLKCVSDVIMTSFLCLCICISPQIITLTFLQKKGCCSSSSLCSLTAPRLFLDSSRLQCKVRGSQERDQNRRPWTRQTSLTKLLTHRLRLNSSCCLLLVISLLALRWKHCKICNQCPT